MAQHVDDESIWQSQGNEPGDERWGKESRVLAPGTPQCKTLLGKIVGPLVLESSSSPWHPTCFLAFPIFSSTHITGVCHGDTDLYQ